MNCERCDNGKPSLPEDLSPHYNMCLDCAISYYKELLKQLNLYKKGEHGLSRLYPLDRRCGVK